MTRVIQEWKPGNLREKEKRIPTQINKLEQGDPSITPSFRGQYIIFQSSEHDSRCVEVLAGEAGPTPNGGYAKWGRIPRPQRKEITYLEGYSPMQLTVP